MAVKDLNIIAVKVNITQKNYETRNKRIIVESAINRSERAV